MMKIILALRGFWFSIIGMANHKYTHLTYVMIVAIALENAPPKKLTNA